MEGNKEQPIRFTTGKLNGRPVSEAKNGLLHWYYQNAQAGNHIETFLVQKEIARILKRRFLYGKASETPCKLSSGKHCKRTIDRVPISYLRWYFANMPEEETIRQEIAALLGIDYAPQDLKALSKDAGVPFWECSDDVAF